MTNVMEMVINNYIVHLGAMFVGRGLAEPLAPPPTHILRVIAPPLLPSQNMIEKCTDQFNFHVFPIHLGKQNTR